ncbi:zinc finger protein basonuclin-1-like isoform X2 [Leptopilina boulardi]|uniref:zinc finger protein basonuclin-1-like isoform X2 n=1 Tax=Leptopilina boulardi TaxID=63433 RepID=UPI0021F613B0|nr:zinc finger protein basonuclin-1-like isoform X2 [Leptopilina boulardi]
MKKQFLRLSWPNWFLRPEIPVSVPLSNQVSNSNFTLTSSTLSRNHQDTTKLSQASSLNSSKVHGQTPRICTSIRCTVKGCSCDSFVPGKHYLRCCDKCHHGWVLHALARLSSLRGGGVGGDVASSPRVTGGEDKSAGGRVRQAAGGIGGGEPTDVTEKKERPPASETVEPTAAFDVASLVLYGSRALRTPLKNLLDKLFNQLPHTQVTGLLAAFGWTHEDYSRGYILQDSQNGPVLDRWSICSAEEEPLIVQQFLKFAETRPFVHPLLLAAGTPGSDAMSPSRRPSPPTMPLAHLPPPLHLLHCGLPPSSRLPHPLPPPLPPVSHHSMSPTTPKHYPSSAGNHHGPTSTASSPPRQLESNSHLPSPLNRLQNMQPFDFRKLGTLGLPAFPLPPPPSESMMHQSRKSRHQHSPQSPTQLTSASQLRHSVPVAPVSTSGLTYGHSLAVAVSSGALPPSFPGHYPLLSKPSANSTGSGLSGSGLDTHSGGEKSSEFDSDDDEDDEENSGSALNLSRRDSGSKHTVHRVSSLSLQASSLGRPSGIRKPHSPGKRHQWGAAHNMPPNLGTPFINPATGKKRVQCNVCYKTFCDKGALKIHFSAVHLREMHQCTVKGCSMMFSSRRSRNRHSANPNPKLHSPHLRRKISPHDGRSSMAHALVLPPQVGLPVPSSGLNHLSFGSFPLLTPPPDLRSPASLCGLDFKHLDSSSNVRSYEEALQQRVSIASSSASLAFSTTTATSTMSKGSTSTISISGVSPSSQTAGMMEDDDDDDNDDGGIVVVAEDECNLPTRLSDDDQPADFSLTGRTKLSLGDNPDEELVSNAESNEDNDSISRFDQHNTFSINPHTMNSTFHNRGVRKRKSQHPTRCTIPAEVHSSSTDGDSSNDAVFQDQPEDMSMSRLEAEERKNSPSPRNSTSFDNESNSRSPELTRNRRESDDNHDEPRDLSSRASSVRSPKRQTTSPEPKYSPNSEAVSPRPSREERNENDDNGEPEEKLPKLMPKDDDEPMEIEEDEEVATTLRNQEGERPDDDPPRVPSSIDSHPTTADDLSLDSSNALRQLESLSQGHIMMPYTTGMQEQPSRSGRVSTSPVSLTMHQDTTLDNSSHGSHSSSGSPSPVAMDTDNSLITYARYENGGFVSTQEVPLDRENPRRCTACGKVFQNHFGVKTHYQNVHLKLMHRCSVDGCNAAFPSKRSRDRHSANLNLHRKLLSTSTSPPLITNPTTTLTSNHSIEDSLNPLLHNEFLARLYADAGIGALGTFPLSGLTGPSAIDLAARIPPPHPLLLPPHLGFPGLSTFASHLAGLNGLTTHHQLNLRSNSSSPPPDDQKQEANKCTIPGCNRIFGSRAVRDAHSRDPQAHRDLPILSTSGS